MKVKNIGTIVVLMFIILMLFFNTTCMAKVSTGLYKPGSLNISDNARAFEMGTTIVTVLKTVGVVVAVVGIMILGIKYMVGSVEQKAEYKKTMIPYIVGCIFIFAIGQIVSIIYNLATQI